MMVNEFIEEGLTQTTGTARISRRRRKLLPKSDPARAAVAYLLGYLGQAAMARRWWPWYGRPQITAGDADVLEMAGALIAQEIDRRQGRWAISGAPSASSHS